MGRGKNKDKDVGQEEIKIDKKINVRMVGKDTGQVVGYINETRVRAGEVISIKESMFSNRCMEKVGKDAVSDLGNEEERVEMALSDPKAAAEVKRF